MNYTEKGSRSYLFSIVLVAVLGGLCPSAKVSFPTGYAGFLFL